LNFATDWSGRSPPRATTGGDLLSLTALMIETKRPCKKYCHNAQVGECGRVAKTYDRLAGRFLEMVDGHAEKHFLTG